MISVAIVELLGIAAVVQDDFIRDCRTSDPFPQYLQPYPINRQSSVFIKAAQDDIERTCTLLTLYYAISRSREFSILDTWSLYRLCFVSFDLPCRAPPVKLVDGPTRSETFDPALSLRAVLEEKCTALHGVPTMFTAQLALLDKLDKGGNVAGLNGIELDFSSLRSVQVCLWREFGEGTND